MAKRKRNNTFIFILVAVIIALLAVVIWKQKTKETGIKVSVEKVEKRTIKEIVAASGKVFPQTEVKISSDVSGEVVDLFIEEGDSVIAGQLLAKIDPDAYQSQVERGVAGVNSSKAQLANSKSAIEQVKASKAQIEAQLFNAREIHKRNEQLKADGVIADSDFDASQASVRSLEANLRAAEANIRSAQESSNAASFAVNSAQATLKELRTSLKRTTIYAPVNGIISQLNIEQGERVVGTIQMTGTEMMRIANLNEMEVRVDVSENDIPRVTLGDVVEIEVDAYLNRTFLGTVTQIAHSATGSGTSLSLTSDQVTNFEVRINMDPKSYVDLVSPEKPYPFRPGMSASVEINTEQLENVLSIPIQSVTTREKDGGKKKKMDSEGEEEKKEKGIDDLIEVVFIAMEGDTVKMVEVVTGIQDDEFIEVLSGLEDSTEVVTAPYSAISRKLESGKEINKVKEEELYGGDKKD